VLTARGKQTENTKDNLRSVKFRDGSRSYHMPPYSSGMVGERASVMRSLLIATLITALVPDLAFAQRVTGARPSLAAGGSSSSRDASDSPGPLWTRRSSVERPVPAVQPKAAAIVTRTEAIKADTVQDEDKLLDKKIRSICRGC